MGKLPVPCSTLTLLMLGPGTPSHTRRFARWPTTDVWWHRLAKRESASTLRAQAKCVPPRPPASGVALLASGVETDRRYAAISDEVHGRSGRVAQPYSDPRQGRGA